MPHPCARQAEVCTRPPAEPYGASWKGTGVSRLCFRAARDLPCLPLPLSVGLRSGPLSRAPRAQGVAVRVPSACSPNHCPLPAWDTSWNSASVITAADPGWEAAGTWTSAGHTVPWGSHGRNDPGPAWPRNASATTELLNSHQPQHQEMGRDGSEQRLRKAAEAGRVMARGGQSR